MKKSGDNGAGVAARLLNLLILLSRKQEVRLETILREIYEVTPQKYESCCKQFQRDKGLIEDLFNKGLLKNAGEYIAADKNDKNANYDEDEPNRVTIKGHGRGDKLRYKLMNLQFLMLPLRLNDDDDYISNDVISLISGLNLASHFMPCFKNSVDNVKTNVERYLTTDQKEAAQILEQAFTVAMPISEVKDANLFKIILRAIDEKKVLRIGEYRTREGEKKIEYVSPWILYFKHYTWYIWGQSTSHPFSKSFRLTRMKNVTISDHIRYIESPEGGNESKSKIQIRQDLLHEFVQLDRNPENPFKEYNIKLRIFPTYSFSAKDNIDWFPHQHISPDPENEGAIIYEVKLHGLEDITRWILRAVDCFEVLEPQELKDKIQEKIGKYLSRCTGDK